MLYNSHLKVVRWRNWGKIKLRSGFADSEPLVGREGKIAQHGGQWLRHFLLWVLVREQTELPTTLLIQHYNGFDANVLRLK